MADVIRVEQRTYGTIRFEVAVLLAITLRPFGARMLRASIQRSSFSWRMASLGCFSMQKKKRFQGYSPTDVAEKAGTEESRRRIVCRGVEGFSPRGNAVSVPHRYFYVPHISIGIFYIG